MDNQNADLDQMDIKEEIVEEDMARAVGEDLELSESEQIEAEEIEESDTYDLLTAHFV